VTLRCTPESCQPANSPIMKGHLHELFRPVQCVLNGREQGSTNLSSNESNHQNPFEHSTQVRRLNFETKVNPRTSAKQSLQPPFLLVIETCPSSTLE
jgi:hypothetical protein